MPHIIRPRPPFDASLAHKCPVCAGGSLVELCCYFIFCYDVWLRWRFQGHNRFPYFPRMLGPRYARPFRCGYARTRGALPEGHAAPIAQVLLDDGGDGGAVRTAEQSDCLCPRPQSGLQVCAPEGSARCSGARGARVDSAAIVVLVCHFHMLLNLLLCGGHGWPQLPPPPPAQEQRSGQNSRRCFSATFGTVGFGGWQLSVTIKFSLSFGAGDDISGMLPLPSARDVHAPPWTWLSGPR